MTFGIWETVAIRDFHMEIWHFYADLDVVTVISGAVDADSGAIVFEHVVNVKI